jgi:hypothetical protein
MLSTTEALAATNKTSLHKFILPPQGGSRYSSVEKNEDSPAAKKKPSASVRELVLEKYQDLVKA